MRTALARRRNAARSESETDRDKRERDATPAGGQGARINFNRINAVARARLPEILAIWLPDGRREGAEWVARNPRRVDRRLGSFRINLTTGRWADFALADVRGGDLVSLRAYLDDVRQGEAARRLAAELGIPLDG